MHRAFAPASRGRASRLRVLAAIALFALVPVACSNASKTEGTPAPVAPVLEPIPAPPGLLAEISIASPETTWKEARVAIGGPALFMPQSIGGFLSVALGLPITVAGEFDGNLPALGAIIDAPDRPQPYAALGVHVRVGERLVDQLTKGEGARFVSAIDAATGLVSLEAKGSVKAPVAMGLLGNYLLFGRELADIKAAGPYIARTLAKSPRPAKEDVVFDLPDAALSGPIRTSLKRVSESFKGSSAAVAPLLPLDRAVEKLLEIVPDLARARVSLDLDGPAVRARVAGSRRPGGGPATAAIQAMSVGDVAPLRGLPSDTLIAFLDRMSLTASAGGAPRAEPPAGSAVAKLSKDDRDALYAALDAVNDARGPFFAGGMSFESTGPLGYIRSGAPDEERLTKALKDFVVVLKRPSVQAWIEGEGFTLKAGKAVIDGIAGDVQRLTIARLDGGDADSGKGAKGAASDKTKRSEATKGAKNAKNAKGATSAEPDVAAPPPGDVPTSIDILYSVRKEGLFATAGYRSKEGFASLLAAAAAPSGGFGDSPSTKAALDGLGADVALALIADPLRLIAARAGKPGAGESAPFVVALGRSAAADELWLRVDVAISVIQELVKHRGALSL